MERIYRKCLVLLAALFITTSPLFSQTWVQKASLPSMNGGFEPIAFSINGKLYVGGGYWNGSVVNTFQEYDPTTDTWTPKANLLQGMYASGCFVLNGKGYMVSGVNPSLTNVVYMYDPVADTWTQKNNFPGSARQISVGFSLNGKGYVFGGFTGGSSVTNDMWEYDASADSWTQKSSAPGPGRNAPAKLIINNQAYVGLGSNTSGSSSYSDFYRYDPVADSYTQVASLPVSRAACAHFTVGGIGYIGVGQFGTGSSFSMLDDFYKYDPTANTWTQINNFGGIARAWVYSETVGNLPYVGAGADLLGSVYHNDNWTWDVCRLNINLGTDTTLCSGSSLALRDTTSGAAFLWSTGATTSSINVDSTGQYWLEVTQGACVGRDTINVSFSSAPAPFSLGSDTTYCGNFARLLSTGNAGTHWSTGAVASSISVTSPGLYWADITNACGNARDSIEVTQKQFPSVQLGADTSLCSGSSLILNDTISGATFIWSTGSTGSSIDVTSTGQYWLEVTQGACVGRDTINVSFADTLSAIVLTGDTLICDDSAIVLNAYEPYAKYRWSTGDSVASILVSQTGTYVVTVSNACGSISASKSITTHQCGCKIAIPTAFSPNNDGKNDRFGILTQCPISNFKIDIYNRWGQLIYVGTNMADKWDGTYKGQPQPAGVYVWYIQYTDPYAGISRRESGNVTLLR